MQDNEKVYGAHKNNFLFSRFLVRTAFTISLPEYGETIETLWETVKSAYYSHHMRVPFDSSVLL
jgi:hypothetical protein